MREAAEMCGVTRASNRLHLCKSYRPLTQQGPTMSLLHTLPEFGRVVRHFIVYGACTKRIQHGR